MFPPDMFWLTPLPDKKAQTDLDGFLGKVNKSKCKPNKLWVVQEKEFYNNLIHG